MRPRLIHLHVIYFVAQLDCIGKEQTSTALVANTDCPPRKYGRGLAVVVTNGWAGHLQVGSEQSPAGCSRTAKTKSINKKKSIRRTLGHDRA